MPTPDELPDCKCGGLAKPIGRQPKWSGQVPNEPFSPGPDVWEYRVGCGRIRCAASTRWCDTPEEAAAAWRRMNETTETGE